MEVCGERRRYEIAQKSGRMSEAEKYYMIAPWL